MAWYYMDGGQENGPVDKSQLQELIRVKRINAKTLVRNETMGTWRALAEMVHGKASAQAGASAAPAPVPGAPPISSGPPPAPSARPAAETLFCSQCGRSFPKEQVVKFDNQVICAACKPIFVQRLREGVRTPGMFKYAGFWIRFGAKIIDGLILAAVQYAIIIPMTVLFFSSDSGLSENPEEIFSTGSLLLIGLQQLIAVLIPAAYNTFFIGRYGATLGKMACRIQVLTPEGARISYLRALGRYFAEILSAIVLGIGYLMAGFDQEKRALHDRICSTRVVYK